MERVELIDCERNESFVTIEKAEYICERLENAIVTIDRVLNLILDSGDIDEPIMYLISCLRALSNQLSTVDLCYWREKLQQFLTSTEESFTAALQVYPSKKQGRPTVDAEQIVFLHEIGLSWKDIAKLIG